MSKSDGKYDDDEDEYVSEGKFSESKAMDDKTSDFPQIDIVCVEIEPVRSGLKDPFDLKITFTLDRDVVAAFWRIKFLVDSADKRVYTVLGETSIEDYPDGESDMFFAVDTIDVSNIPKSTLANAALLIAEFVEMEKKLQV
eukprot:CAMPEP_0182428898 /NCGR_PEP_ID=MMETSP1167-20130531/24442_1 /TAXON_ID=2988 /ORGANISM="Mallomonas Sp, Strain CCMP3275" /LENGTH=140 /DNA_ID=CAMNT_0024612103 /DNA_START=149 /DNA_END=572 /DNA_ORIENTATION=+